MAIAGAASTAPASAMPTTSTGQFVVAARHFTLCPVGSGRDCVVDGDTMRIGKTRVRLADIDAPETHPSRCRREADLGLRATIRLQQLLDGQAFKATFAIRPYDRFGRRLMVLSRGGRSIGQMLVAEGLARPWSGGRLPWC